MSAKYKLIVTCPLYCEDLAAEELAAFGLPETALRHGAVMARGTLEDAYRMCLWSRIANKVLLPLVEFEAENKEEMLERLSAFAFPDHFSSRATFAVESQIAHTFFANPNYASLVVKDAVADSFRSAGHSRPDVDTRRPDLRLSLFLEGRKGTVSLELDAQGLYKRAYRTLGGGEAPLKENVAAAILMRAGWPEIAAAGGPFVDLMCGSGTFLFEALLAAGNIAPSALRLPGGPVKWKGHEAALWQRLVSEVAEGKRRALAGKLPPVIGYDIDGEAVRRARADVKAAGLERFIHVERADFHDVRAPGGAAGNGLVAANPPYGRRLGGGSDLPALYSDLGRVLSAAFDGYRACVLAGDRDLARAVGLRAEKLHTILNGPIRCTLAHFRLGPANKFRPPKNQGSPQFTAE